MRLWIIVHSIFISLQEPSGDEETDTHGMCVAVDNITTLALLLYSTEQWKQTLNYLPTSGCYASARYGSHVPNHHIYCTVQYVELVAWRGQVSVML
jgi:hypothetical protein